MCLKMQEQTKYKRLNGNWRTKSTVKVIKTRKTRLIKEVN